MRNQTQPPRSSRPAAFTLVELLVAIGIIAILVGLLSPAIYSVMIRARITEVKQDISKIEGAISDFHLKFGMNPPSRIRLYETGNQGTGTGWYAGDAETRRSRSIIRRLWPDFNFSQPVDLNMNGSIDTAPIDLVGAQCLTFFLGGRFMPFEEDSNSDGSPDTDYDGDGVLDVGGGFIGFSSAPTNPFGLPWDVDANKDGTPDNPSIDLNGANGPDRIESFVNTSSTRIGPFLDFDMRRIPSNALPFPVYVDTLASQTAPYLYASSNEGLGYESADIAPMSDVYRIGAGSSGATWNQKSYQIISPGFDGQYGVGGVYTPDATTKLPGAAARRAENDNITNFSDGVLVP